ncbi:MAG: AraC family transcriptional regulator [Paenibacillus sp.]|nr:AraC family transcriptional regulator [Paenibacillus sp.]
MDEARHDDFWFKLLRIMPLDKWNESLEKQRTFQADTYLLLVVQHGEMHISSEGRTTELVQGSILIGAPGQRIAYIGNGAKKAELGYRLHFDLQGDPQLKQEFDRDLEQRRYATYLPEAKLAALLDQCEKACRYWHHPSRWERLRGQTLFQEMMYLLFNEAETASTDDLDAALEQVKLYLDAHYQENPSIEQLAHQIGVSSRHFRRAFKLRFGISAIDYVTDLKMAHAKRHMTAVKPNMADIARQVGYQDESHFRRTFKNRTGITPALYVKNRQLKVAACSFPNIGQLLPLSIIPFAAPIDHEWTDMYRRKYHMDVQYPLFHHNEQNFKTLAAAKPDYILAIDVFWTDEFQQNLRQIAPVLVIPWRTTSWRDHLLLTAAFLDKTKEADEWLAVYEDKLERVCAEWNKLARSEQLHVVMIDGHHCYSWKTGADGSMDRLTFPFAPARHLKTTIDPLFERSSFESVLESEADRIVLLVSEDRQSQLTWEKVKRLPGWSSMKAMRRDRVHPILLGPGFEYTAHNHGIILDQVIKALL